MNNYSDMDQVLINRLQYMEEIFINKKIKSPTPNNIGLYGVVVEIHDDGTSQFAHKETE